MKTHDVTHLDTQIKEMCHSLANLADEKDFEEFRLLIRKPGWTTVAELSLVTGVVDSMHSQLKTLTGLKQVLLIGSRAVRSEVNLPSPEEIDAMSIFPPNDNECDVLCEEILDTVAELQGATGFWRLRLLARLRAINARRRELHCKLCLPD